MDLPFLQVIREDQPISGDVRSLFYRHACKVIVIEQNAKPAGGKIQCKYIAGSSEFGGAGRSGVKINLMKLIRIGPLDFLKGNCAFCLY